MNTAMKISGLVFLVLLGMGCSQKEKGGEAQWPDKMQKLASALTDLLPIVYNPTEFENPEKRDLIKEKIDAFYQASHVIPKDKAEQILGKDPLVNLSIQNLEKEVASAKSSFERGNYRYSRHLLQHTLNYCFACHTRSQLGPKYEFWDLKSLKAANIDVIQKSKIMVATRQYDKAKEVLKAYLLSGKKEGENPYLQEQAIKQYLAVVVRAEESPKEGYTFVNDLVGRISLPVYLQKNVKSWEGSFLKWMSEKTKPFSQKDLTKAKGLVEKSDFLTSGADGEGKYVDYLRASTILHGLLATDLKKSQRAESLFYLGSIYSLLSDSGFWELPEVYYEACIREAPKSGIAKKCFSNYEQDIVLGYSGSAGTFVPKDEKMKLDELREIAGY